MDAADADSSDATPEDEERASKWVSGVAKPAIVAAAVEVEVEVEVGVARGWSTTECDRAPCANGVPVLVLDAEAGNVVAVDGVAVVDTVGDVSTSID